MGASNLIDGDQALAIESHFAYWDSGYYLRIAESGYRPNGPERAFFPLYPMLTRLVSGYTGLSLLRSGWVISMMGFLAGGVLLHHWMRAEYGARTALWGLIWFCFFPVSFFSIGFYPESLYLFLSIGAIYFARCGWFPASGLCIAVAGAAWPVGFLLAVPYIVEFMLQRDFRRVRWLQFITGASIAPLGTLAYLIFLAIQGGGADPVALYNDNLEQHWRMSFAWP